MAAIQCYTPGMYAALECHKTKVYGFVQGGYTLNTDNPNDRENFGVNFNHRSNDFRLNQVYLIVEKTLEQNDCVNWGYRADFLVGHDAPFIVANGMFDNFVGGHKQNRIGVDIPQAYAEVHLPYLLEKGIDVRVGKFYTLHGNELTPGTQTDFYSHSYGYFYAWPFTHTSVM